MKPSVRAGLCLIFAATTFPVVAQTNEISKCTDLYRPAAADMLSFLDKRVGLDVLNDNEKLRAKHGLNSRKCIVDGLNFIERKDMDHIYCPDMSGSSFIVPGEGVGVAKEGVNQLSDKVYSDGSGSRQITFGQFLDGKYYFSDVKRALNKSVKGLADNYSEDSYIQSSSSAAPKFSYKGRYYRLLVHAMGGIGHGSYDKVMSKTYIEYKIDDKTRDVNECINKAQLNAERIRAEEAVRDKGKRLVIN